MAEQIQHDDWWIENIDENWQSIFTKWHWLKWRKTNNPSWRPRWALNKSTLIELWQKVLENEGRIETKDIVKKYWVDIFKDADFDPDDDNLNDNSKYNLDNVNRFLSILRVDGTIAEACRQTWISYDTIDRWRKKYKKFDEAVDKAKDFLKIAARNVLFEEIVKNKNSKFALEFLNRRDERYVEKKETIQDKTLTLKEWQFKMIFWELNRLKWEGKLWGYIEKDIIKEFNQNKQTIFDADELKKKPLSWDFESFMDWQEKE